MPSVLPRASRLPVAVFSHPPRCAAALRAGMPRSSRTISASTNSATLRVLENGSTLPIVRDPPRNATGKALFYLGRKLHLPAHAYLLGLNHVADHNAGGHSSYLLGMRSETGWWYYFPVVDRKSTRLNSSHLGISYAVFCLKKKKNKKQQTIETRTVLATCRAAVSPTSAAQTLTGFFLFWPVSVFCMFIFFSFFFF